ncbi:hypothetical protein CANARDRAFT_27153 [[Candida] arabinofermentans NRRL YB-2248]|uniref:Sulfhydryl oxidase n=1 Tax=[Candida] arabinofermentans NRRL YB-2248 TaxID=983967 RepID=A0A1E4T4R3_9ASCO|nr:hypothetical protein CANARDRAFT_27153 [[Candida] arabinofermentans NRRL YB-2248]
MSEEASKSSKTQPSLDTPPTPAGMPKFGASGKKIIYDEDGKPCRSCNSLLDFKSATHFNKGGASNSNASSKVPPGLTGVAGVAASSNTTSEGDSGSLECPPDVNELGRATWTFLHSVAATYPKEATLVQQQEMTTFISIFSKIYPCWFCAKDFQEHVKKNQVKVKTQEEFGRWLCDAHNEVNVKLGKPKFDCNLWKERWKDGWKDGRCD